MKRRQMVNKLTRGLCKLAFWQSHKWSIRLTLRRSATPAKTARQNGICFVGGNVIDKLMGVDLSFHRLAVVFPFFFHFSYSNLFADEWAVCLRLHCCPSVLMLRYKLPQISIGRWLMGIWNARIASRRYNGVPSWSEFRCPLRAEQNKIQFMVTSGWQTLTLFGAACGDI